MRCRNVHHIVDATEQQKIAVLVDARTVADEICVLESAQNLLVGLGSP